MLLTFIDFIFDLIGERESLSADISICLTWWETLASALIARLSDRCWWHLVSTGPAQFWLSSWSHKQICTQFQFPEWKKHSSFVMRCSHIWSLNDCVSLWAVSCSSHAQLVIKRCSDQTVRTPTTRGAVPSKEPAASWASLSKHCMHRDHWKWADPIFTNISVQLQISKGARLNSFCDVTQHCPLSLDSVLNAWISRILTPSQQYFFP